MQVHDSVKTYSKYLPLRSVCVYGGVDIRPQIAELREGREIVVATPGRLLDHVQQKSVSFANVEVLVLDEADRMLDMGFMPDIKRILALLPAERQSLLFSATFSDEIKRLANQMLRNPVSIEVARRNAPTDLVTHRMYEVDADRKGLLLAHLIKSRDMQQVLVFVRTKRDANRLMRELVRDGVPATAIHSDRTQGERMQALEDFKNGTMKVMVATDIAARGLDIEQLPFVINFELPYAAEDYIHRIGRTGRAGSPGEAISLVCSDEKRMLDDIERELKRKLERLPMPELAGARPRAPRHHEERSASEHRAPRSNLHAVPAAKPVHAAKPAHAVSAGGFDFSKPYEPKPSSLTNGGAAPASTTARAPMRRQTAALLGGHAKKS